MSALPAFVAAFVPLRILEMLRKGGPTDLDYELARNFADTLAEHADTLLYGGNPGEAAALANQLVDAIAVMAFLPGGIIIFDRHFAVRREGAAVNKIWMNLSDGSTCHGGPVDGEPEPPDLEYTPITAPLPAVVDAAEAERLREQITELHCDYSAQIATLELRVRELEAWIDAVPSGALIDYYYGSEARSYDGRAATNEVGAWIRRLEDENAIALREARP